MKPDLEKTGRAVGADNERLERLIRELLVEVGENPDREGLLRSPERVAEAWRTFTRGYTQDVAEVIAEGVFEDNHDEMVLVKDIEFYSLCEHHLVPFFGKCHIAYLPRGKIIGLSKLVRVIEVYSRRLQVQERMTSDIGSSLARHLGARGVAVLTEAQHLCMIMRGVERHNAVVTTTAMLGEFETDAARRAEFLGMIGLGVPR